MIVLTIIGVLTAILMPSAHHSMPDKNILKFKKANTAFATVIREMVSSDEYFTDGNLTRNANGGTVSDTYVCQTMVDIMTTKSVNCAFGAHNSYTGYIHTVDFSSLNEAKSMLDRVCESDRAPLLSSIILPDGTHLFDASPSDTFQNIYPKFDTNGFLATYKIFCIDIDGPWSGENAFGYGVRSDGKILMGLRAEEWMNKNIQRDE